MASTTCSFPSTVKQAAASPDAEKWRQPMREELDALMPNTTWTLVQGNQSDNVLGGRWVFTIKQGDMGLHRYKACWVAQGYEQVRGLDFDETFAPTLGRASLRILLTIAARRGWVCEQINIKTAFLNGSLEHNINIE